MPAKAFIDGSDDSRQGLYRSRGSRFLTAGTALIRNEDFPRDIFILDEPPEGGTKLVYRDLSGGTLKVAVGDPNFGLAAPLEGAVYAYSEDWTLTTLPSTATATQTVVGSATAKGVVTLTLPDDMQSGSFRLGFDRAQTWKVNFIGNTAVRDRFFVLFTNLSVASDLNGHFIDTEDSAGPVRIWFDHNNTGVAPATPLGGRLLEVDYNTTSATTIAAALKAKLAADSEFSDSQLYSTTNVMVYATTAGTRDTAALSSGMPNTTLNSGVSAVAGTNGRLGGTYFPLADKDGSVAVWFRVHEDDEPEHGLNRSIMVTTISAAGVASAIDADAQFTATASGNVITVVDVATGTRSIVDLENTSGCKVSVVTAGADLLEELPYSATVTDLDDAFGSHWTVTTTKPNEFRFVALTNGVWAAPTITSNFVAPQYFTGTLSLATEELADAFDATTDDYLEAFLEVEYTDADGNETTPLRLPVTLYRDLISEGTLVPVSVNAVVTVSRDSGATTRFAASADTDVARGTALIAAVAAATAGDVIKLGPGTFTLGNNVLTLPTSVHLIGSGMAATIITSTSELTPGKGAIVKPGTGSYVADLTIQGVAASGTYQVPLGCVSSATPAQTAFTGAVFSSLRLIADTDGYYDDNTSTAVGYDLRIEAKYDGVRLLALGCTLDLYNPSVVIVGPSGIAAAPTRAVAVSQGNYRQFGGVLAVSGSSTANLGATMPGVSGTIELHNVSISSSGTGSFDLTNPSGGTLSVRSGEGSGTGGVYTTSGTITYLDTLAGTAPTAAGLALLDDASTTAQRNTLGANSGVWPATLGGTGFSTIDNGDLLVGTIGNAMAKLADVATGNALISGGVGVAPSWGQIGLTTHVTGTLPVANGGTGVTTSTGTGNNVLSASPTFTGTLAAAAGTFSGTLSVTGILSAPGFININNGGINTYIGNAGNGVLALFNSGFTDAVGLRMGQSGATTGAYLKKNAGGIDLRGGDDAAYTALGAGAVTLHEAATPATPSNARVLFTNTANQLATVGENGLLATIPLILAQSAVAVSTTGNLTENALATITIPANTLGANGRLLIWTVWSHTNSANAKTLRVRFSGAAGTTYLQISPTTTATYSDFRMIANQGATNSQVGMSLGTSGGFGTSGSATSTSTADTTTATTVVITGQNSLAAETITLVSYTLLALPSP